MSATITFDPPADPLTDGSAREPHPPKIADSLAYSVFSYHLERYLKRELAGQSFLIGGERGSGKTTMVIHAIERMQRTHERVLDRLRAGRATQEESELLRFDGKTGEESIRLLRPFPVVINGPTLIDEAQAAKKPKDGTEGKRGPDRVQAGKGTVTVVVNGRQDGDEAKERGGDSDSPEAGSNNTVLTTIMQHLYRALARELHSAFYAYIKHRAKTKGFNLTAQKRWREQAAQLRVELDRWPDVARLRSFWQRVGALDSGVLFAIERYVYEHASSAERKRYRPKGQGQKELLALSVAGEAYKLASGSQDSEQIRDQKNAALRQARFSFDSKEFRTGLGVALGTAPAAAAISSISSGFGWLGLTLAALIVAGSIFSVSFVRSRSWQRSEQRKTRFIPKLDASNLGREIPYVISRLQHANLAPVFIFDELDKVEKDDITGLFKGLKKVFTESAFTCFLVGSDYFFKIENESGRKQNTPEQSLFSRRIFASFLPHEIGEFVGQAVKPRSEQQEMKGAGQRQDPKAGPEAGGQDAGGAKKNEAATTSWEAESTNLMRTFIADLIFKSHMNPLYLKRELDRVFGRGFQTIRISEMWSVMRGSRQTYGYTMAMFAALDNDKIFDWIAGNSFNRYIAIECLFFPWDWNILKGGRDLHLQLDDVIEYLRCVEIIARPSEPEDKAGSPRTDEPPQSKTIEGLWEEYLRPLLWRMLWFLCNPAKLREHWHAVAEYLAKRPGGPDNPRDFLGHLEAQAGKDGKPDFIGTRTEMQLFAVALFDEERLPKWKISRSLKPIFRKASDRKKWFPDRPVEGMSFSKLKDPDD